MSHNQSQDYLNKTPISALLLLMITALFSGSLFCSDSQYLQQREWFRDAENALKLGQRQQFTELMEKLQDYPVVAYLKQDDLKSRLANAKKQEVATFLDQYADYPFTYNLQNQWLKTLAKKEQWTDYLAFYQGQKSAHYKCLELTARLNTNTDTITINKEIERIWDSGYSQPDVCDKPFEHLLETSKNRDDIIWSRIEKAFEARRSSLARYLSRKLDESHQPRFDLWYQAHRTPEKTLKKATRLKDDNEHRKVVLHALNRLARKDSLKSNQYWQKIESQFAFTKDQKQSINKRVALSAAYQHEPESKELLQQLPDHLKTDNAHLWLARIHLRDEDWIGLIKTINAMPERLKKETEWEYWLARAYQEAGQTGNAAARFNTLAKKSTYYGFLAADKVNAGYTIRQQSASDINDDIEQQILSSNDHLLRARELFFLDRLLDARREWFQAIRKMNPTEIRQAASMASRWKWHDNAIKTVAKTSHRNDYDLRFPMPYQNLVMQNVKQHDLDPSVIYGVMRRESLFDPLAQSRVGALGLMQLMPATARHVAKKIGLKRTRQHDILDINNNIRLGTSYFRSVLNTFENNVTLATAAYNGGPHNVKKWLPQGTALSADQWVESVPFKETRNYIQAVLAYATIFDKHLGKNVKISSRMQDVKSSY